MAQHIIYIPGLGDRYDFIRKLGLLLWRRPGVVVTHVPMRWLDSQEPFEQKLMRIGRAIDLYKTHEVVVVGESAGGAMALAALRRYEAQISRLVTICGMNHGANEVRRALYRKNPAFRDTMLEADSVVSGLTVNQKGLILTIFSSADLTVRPRHTLLEGVRSHDIKVPGHMLAILATLFLRRTLVYK